jgi:hypothetical protein
MLPLYISDVPLSCINAAAIEYHIPAKLIISVLNTERGKVGLLSNNTNKTYDIGPMQINSLWLSELKRYGIAEHELRFDPCINVQVGTWVLSKAIAKSNDLHHGVGDYHSHTLIKNANYNRQVRMTFTKLDLLLKQRDDYGKSIGADNLSRG